MESMKTNNAAANLSTLNAEIATYEAHRDASYEAAEAADKAGDVEASARHDAWLERFEAILTSLYASRYVLQAEVA